MRYSAIIWDFDGTLLDTYPLMAEHMALALAELGVQEAPEAILVRLLDSFGACIAYYEEAHGLSGQELLRRYRAIEASCNRQPFPFPGVKSLLREFRDRGGRSFVFTHRGESAVAYLEKAKLADYFADIVTWDERFRRKPDPSGNRYLIEKHNLNPAELLAVGDREIDILAGHAAGAATCLFRNEPIRTTADYRICEMSSLRSILELEESC